MAMAKQKMKEIIREFAFERMIERGLDDIRNHRIFSDEEMRRRIRAMAGHSSNFAHSSPIKAVRADPALRGVCDAAFGTNNCINAISTTKSDSKTVTLCEFKGICQVSSK